MSESKLARDVVVGDRVWRAGRYWLVTASDNVGGHICTLGLSHQNRRTTWRHPANYGVAVAITQEIRDGKAPV